MKKRTSVTIAGNEYHLIGAENEEYTRKVAAHLDSKISEILNSGNTSLLEAAILAGVNIADDYYKVLDTADNLRAQLKEYLDQAGKMKMEISELKREIMRLGK
jgi:cell division protein ZapA